MSRFTEITSSPKWNVLITIAICVLSTVLLYTADYGSNGKARLAIIWIPLILTAFTIIAYQLSRLVGKKYNWIISLIGVLVMLYISIPIFFIGVK